MNYYTNPAQIQRKSDPIALVHCNGELVNLFDVLESALVVNCDYLSINDSNGLSARQIEWWAISLTENVFSGCEEYCYEGLGKIWIDGGTFY